MIDYWEPLHVETPVKNLDIDCVGKILGRGLPMSCKKLFGSDDIKFRSIGNGEHVASFDFNAGCVRGKTREEKIKNLETSFKNGMRRATRSCKKIIGE